MCGMATLAMEVSRASMKVARVTVMAMTQGLARGRHVSWNEIVAAAANAAPFLLLSSLHGGDFGGWFSAGYSGPRVDVARNCLIQVAATIRERRPSTNLNRTK